MSSVPTRLLASVLLMVSVTVLSVGTVVVANAAGAEEVNLLRGEAFFNTSFVMAPSSATLRDGLGPLFNAASCDQCHHRSGRRRRARSGQPLPISMVVQLSQYDPGHGWALHSAYGNTFNPQAVAGVAPEGVVSVSWHKIAGHYPDGERWQLSAPDYHFADLAYGPMGDGTAFSVRSARPLLGIGLLARVPDAVVLALADPDDSDGDGIAGQPNWVVVDGERQLGRFGWKANHPDLESQITAALLNEQGISSPRRPGSGCSLTQQDCRQAPSGGDPEITDSDLANLVTFVANLPAPVPQPAAGAASGAKIFTDIGCQKCHQPLLRWQDSEGRQADIAPYTDLLLHDLGKALADRRPDHSASGRQWRTAPLWGLGLAYRAGLPTCYLHDCRARTLEEAVLWHGGEAAPSRQAFMALPDDDRHALIGFLRRL